MGSLDDIVSVARAPKGAAVMAVLNTTPDSFSDGGRFTTPAAIEERLTQLLQAGADLIDIGAESTRPGAKPVSAEEQWERSHFAVSCAVRLGATVSVDTTLPSVAEKALRAGARVINDVSCLTDPDLARVVAREDADLVIMHSRGSMTNMQGFSVYDRDAYRDVAREVAEEWSAARGRAEAAGVQRARIWMDPGFGFHKSAEQSAELLRRLGQLTTTCKRLLVGTSRKSFLAAIDDAPADQRLGATIATCLLAVQAGASILRVHDVFEVNQALRALRTFEPSSAPGTPTTPSNPTLEPKASPAQGGLFRA